MAVDLTRGGQFALIPAKVLYDDQLPATAKLLYGEIYRIAYANGYCYASNKDFMELLRCSEDTARRLISNLVERKHIRVKMIRRYGASGDIVERRIFCGQELAKEDPPEGTGEGEGGPLKNKGRSPQNYGEGPLKNAGLTIKKKNNNIPPISPREISAIVEAYSSGDTELSKAIMGLLENRAVAKKNPVKTAQALNGILNKLTRLSDGSRAAKLLLLENAITHNWLTVFPLKPDELAALKQDSGGEEVFGWR